MITMKYLDYVTAVREVAAGFFDEEGNYTPEIGRGNILRVFCQIYLKNAGAAGELDIEKLGPFDYVDEALSSSVGKLIHALKNESYFSFGRVLEDAQQIVEHRKAKIAHASRLDELFETLIKKIDELDKNVNQEDMKKVLEALKNKEPLDEETIVKQYWEQKNTEEQERV